MRDLILRRDKGGNIIINCYGINYFHLSECVQSFSETEHVFHLYVWEDCNKCFKLITCY